MLPGIPAGCYVAEEFFRLEQENIWRKIWLFAGYTDELLEISEYKLWDDAGVPVVIARDEDAAIRAFYNTPAGTVVHRWSRLSAVAPSACNAPCHNAPAMAGSLSISTLTPSLCGTTWVPLGMTGFPLLIFWPQDIRTMRMDV